jgi:hypothetical protein
MSTTVGGVRIVDMPDLGAFNSSSSLVGERAGSGRFSASGLAGYFLPITGGTALTVNGTISADVIGANSINSNTGITANSITVGTTLTAGTVDTNAVVTTSINNGGTVTTDHLAANAIQSTVITGATIAASSSFALPVSGGYLTANATTVEFAMDTATWRWEYVRSNGTLRWINGGTAQSLMSIDGSGNMILRGTLTASGTPVLDAVQELRDTVTALAARVAALELTA